MEGWKFFFFCSVAARAHLQSFFARAVCLIGDMLCAALSIVPLRFHAARGFTATIKRGEHGGDRPPNIISAPVL